MELPNNQLHFTLFYCIIYFLYNHAWFMLHKLRNIMGKRDKLYDLTDVVELDEGFFTTERDEEDKDMPLKRGRGSQRKTTVVVMAESKPVEGRTTKLEERWLQK